MYKTDVNSESANPIEILFEVVNSMPISAGAVLRAKNYGSTIPLQQGEYLHLFFANNTVTSWWNKIFIRFKKQ